MKTMKKLKLGITFLSAGLMTYTPLANASIGAPQKSAINHFLKENFKGTYNDLYRNQGFIFDSETRGVLEAWLRNNGNTSIAQPQAAIIKDKTGRDTLKLIFNQSGRNLTLTFTEGNYETFDVNGRKVAFTEIRNAASLLSQLSETDSSLQPLVKNIKTSVIPVSRKSEALSVGQFAKLTRLQRVEYMMIMRQNVEAAQKVYDSVYNRKTAQMQGHSPLFVYHPLFASQIAWATPSENTECIVAGNISVYEKDKTGHLACLPFPMKNPQGFKPQPTFHDRCQGGPTMVACNPLMYGTRPTGEPYCVDSADQPRFTRQATLDCNNASPLTKAGKNFEELNEQEKKSRREDYEKILKSYYSLQGKNADDLKDCFNKDHEISPKCESLFKDQYSQFVKFKDSATKICETVQLQDQKDACIELKKRALGLLTYLERVDVNVPPVNGIDLKACEDAGGKWDNDSADCFCPNAKRANPLGGGKYECPINTQPPTPPVGPQPKKDDCKKEDGSKSHSFKCDPALWLVPLLAVPPLVWLMTRDHDKDPQKPTGPNTPIMPPPVNVVVPGPGPSPGPTPTVTTPTTPTTQPTNPPTPTVPKPATEGSNGQAAGSNGSAGAVRGGAK